MTNNIKMNLRFMTFEEVPMLIALQLQGKQSIRIKIQFNKNIQLKSAFMRCSS